MKKYLIVLILIGALFIFGCAEEEVPIETGAFIGGSQGLVMSFTEGAPPDAVYDRDFPFDISLKLENVGEWSIVNVVDTTVSIIGIDPTDFGKSLVDLKKDSTVPMLGKRLDQQGNVQQGTITNIDFQNFQYRGAVVGRVDFVLRADVCYEYGTRVNTKICVLDDLLGVSRAAGEAPVCEPSETKPFENSGAPVKVTSVKETATGMDRITVTFDITHVGSGTIFRRNTECNPVIADKDKVYFKVNTGLPGLSCSGIEGGGSEGFVTLYGSSRQIICTQQLPAPRGDYEKQITAELTYGYREYIDKTLTVKQTGS
jgi:hypothetical protein